MSNFAEEVSRMVDHLERKLAAPSDLVEVRLTRSHVTKMAAALRGALRLEDQLEHDSKCPSCGEYRECVGCGHNW
jgi:hypothetical protein